MATEPVSVPRVGPEIEKSRPHRPLERLHRFFDRLQAEEFFGKVTVTYQNGRVCDVKVEQTRKLDEL